MDIKELHKQHQSLWLDYFRRDLITSGELARLVRDDGLRGITTNPTIFEQAINGTTLYDASIERSVKSNDEPPDKIYERLAIDDIQRAADVLRPVFDETDGADGFVSMEVSPYLAHDTRGTIEEVRRLWRAVDRPNVMIKIPGTQEGVPAIERSIADGININVTLLFGRDACRQVRNAHMSGLEARLAKNEPIDRIAGVASMFVSRIDVLVEKVLQDPIARDPALSWVVGKVGISNAKLSYQDWKADHASDRWRALASRGARPQRMLWASTSTKNPKLPELLYVEALIGPDTVDTIPPKTLDALRDHGHATSHLEEGLDEAQAVMDALASAGISMDDLAAELVKQGVAKFAASFDTLFAALVKKRDTARAA
jgi:transaldolase/glucose-6-phosphate isomerase